MSFQTHKTIKCKSSFARCCHTAHLFRLHAHNAHDPHCDKTRWSAEQKIVSLWLVQPRTFFGAKNLETRDTKRLMPGYTPKIKTQETGNISASFSRGIRSCFRSFDNLIPALFPPSRWLLHCNCVNKWQKSNRFSIYFFGRHTIFSDKM